MFPDELDVFPFSEPVPELELLFVPVEISLLPRTLKTLCVEVFTKGETLLSG